MKILTIKDMVRKDVPIYYRKLYTGVAVIEFMANSADYRVDFTLEIKPTGEKEITVNFLDPIEYPLVQISNMMKKYIDEMDSVGGLPD